MSGYSIQVTGLKEVQKKLGKIPDNIKQLVDDQLFAAAKDFENRAAQAAPDDTSNLRQKIKAGKIGPMHYEVVSAAPYSAYVEFGTITRVSVPEDLADFAAHFKGKGLRKTGGMMPRPYFFKQRQPVLENLQKKIKGSTQQIMK